MRPGLLLSLTLSLGCGTGNESSGGAEPARTVDVSLPPPFSVTVRALDEAGQPPAGGTAELEGVVAALDPQGRATFGGRVDPATIVVRAPGFLDEPVVLGREDGERTLLLRAKLGPGGAPRAAIHVGGAVMLGRRFLSPAEPDTLFVTDAADARAAVASLAPLFGAADLRLAQVETVLGARPLSEAYPGKSTLFQSPLHLLAALETLRVDVAGLAHDHARDWLDAGLADTLSAVRGAGIDPVGAGLDETEAAAGVVRDVDGLRIGVLAYSSIWGDYVNDGYPDESVPVPPGLAPELAFQYESRVWGHGAIPVQARRVKTAWLEIKAAEPGMSKSARAAQWASATAVYPELQDWIARRGHGGANSTSSARMAAEIQAMRTAGCDVVLVMLHSGHELADHAGESAARHAREAVDAGADVVVHHARVSQGFEVYQGKLICLGLGNALSDQDGMETYLSGILRLVYEGNALLEARYLPIALHRYRPAPLAGRMAGRAIRKALERSSIEALTGLYDGEARAVRAPRPLGAFGASIDAAGRVAAWSGATIALPVATAFEAPAELPETGLVRSRGPGGASLAGLWFGRDLLRWGAFEDDLADGLASGGPQWSPSAASASAGVPVTSDAPSGDRAAHLIRSASHTSRVRLRPVASVPLKAHRLYQATGPDTAAPADGPASYSLAFQARKSGTGATRFSLDVYDGGIFVRSVELPFDVPADDAWHGALLDIASSVFAPLGSLRPDRVTIHVGLHPPSAGLSELRMDDLRFLEWRSPDLQPDGFYEASAVRAATPGAPVVTTLERRSE